MEQPVNPNRNVFAVKNFLKEYLDLRKDKDNELAEIHGNLVDITGLIGHCRLHP